MEIKTPLLKQTTEISLSVLELCSNGKADLKIANKIDKHVRKAMKLFKENNLPAAQDQVDEARPLLRSMKAEKEQE